MKKYPKNIVLGYIKTTDRFVVEFIQLQKNGYNFHNKFFNSFPALEAWFLNHYKNKEYIQFIKKDLTYSKKTGLDRITKIVGNGKVKRCTYLAKVDKVSIISLPHFPLREKK